jgi:hypothetical protein
MKGGRTVANTGYLLLLTDRMKDETWRELREDLEQTVGRSPALKNLEWLPPASFPPGEFGSIPPTSWGLRIDRLEPDSPEVRSFYQRWKGEGVKVFVISSTYGDAWEEVI